MVCCRCGGGAQQRLLGPPPLHPAPASAPATTCWGCPRHGAEPHVVGSSVGVHTQPLPPHPRAAVRGLRSHGTPRWGPHHNWGYGLGVYTPAGTAARRPPHLGGLRSAWRPTTFGGSGLPVTTPPTRPPEHRPWTSTLLRIQPTLDRHHHGGRRHPRPLDGSMAPRQEPLAAPVAATVAAARHMTHRQVAAFTDLFCTQQGCLWTPPRAYPRDSAS